MNNDEIPKFKYYLTYFVQFFFKWLHTCLFVFIFVCIHSLAQSLHIMSLMNKLVLWPFPSLTYIIQQCLMCPKRCMDVVNGMGIKHFIDTWWNTVPQSWVVPPVLVTLICHYGRGTTHHNSRGLESHSTHSRVKPSGVTANPLWLHWVSQRASPAMAMPVVIPLTVCLN